MMPKCFDLKLSCKIFHVNKHEFIYMDRFSCADVKNVSEDVD